MREVKRVEVEDRLKMWGNETLRWSGRADYM